MTVRIIGLRFRIKTGECYGIPSDPPQRPTHIRFYRNHPEAHFVKLPVDASPNNHSNGFWDMQIPENASFFLVKEIKGGKRAVHYKGIKFLNLA